MWVLSDAPAAARRFVAGIVGMARVHFDLRGPVDAVKWSQSVGAVLRPVDAYNHGRYARVGATHEIHIPSSPDNPLARFIFCHELAHMLLENCRSEAAIRKSLDDFTLRSMARFGPGSRGEEYLCDLIASSLLLERSRTGTRMSRLCDWDDLGSPAGLSRREIALAHTLPCGPNFSYVEVSWREARRGWMISELVAPLRSVLRIGMTVHLGSSRGGLDVDLKILQDGNLVWRGSGETRAMVGGDYSVLIR